MKVAGHDEDITAEEYAEQVADQVRAAVRTALAHHETADDVLPDPAAVAESVGEIIVYLPDERPNELAALLGPFWSGAKVRQVLNNASRQLLAERRKSGALLGLKTSDGDVIYPVFQFHRRHGTVEVRPNLAIVTRALRRFDPWTVAVLLRTPAPELEGFTPLDWVRKERPVDPLSEFADHVSRTWSAGSA